ncbi:MAG: hypothetical protein HZA17_03520 [Nitrospirae bacterium]|nr:hypothetical protein [Nitrospirota bacterium]
MKKDELFLKRISAEILSELEQVSKLMAEYEHFGRKYSGNMDTYLLRVQASFMADFYMGVEKIFRTIAEELNGGVPRGDGWHKRLLHSMSLEVKGIRPPVISNILYAELLKFLGFRHVVRQAYGFQLDEKKLEELEGIFVMTWTRFSREIKKFCAFLEGKTK